MAVTYLPRTDAPDDAPAMELLFQYCRTLAPTTRLIENNCRGIMEAMANLSPVNRAISINLQHVIDTSFNQLHNIYDPLVGGSDSSQVHADQPTG